MKTLKLLIPFLLLTIVAKAQLPTDDFYEHFVLDVKPGPAPANYGLSPEAPITLGAYEDLTNQAEINSKLNRFANTYQWPDSGRVNYIDRKTVMINSVNYDEFRTVKPGTKDTITLYVDMYKGGPVSVPACFTVYTKQQLAAEFAPLLTKLKTYMAAPDRYADDKAKTTSVQLLAFLQTNVGLDYLLDKDYVGALMDNYGIDADLKAYLVRSYIFHKFEYALTGQDNIKNKAYNAMVDDYQDVTKKHPDLITGDMSAIMVKKS